MIRLFFGIFCVLLGLLVAMVLNTRPQVPFDLLDFGIYMLAGFIPVAIGIVTLISNQKKTEDAIERILEFLIEIPKPRPIVLILSTLCTLCAVWAIIWPANNMLAIIVSALSGLATLYLIVWRKLMGKLAHDWQKVT